MKLIFEFSEAVVDVKQGYECIALSCHSQLQHLSTGLTRDIPAGRRQRDKAEEARHECKLFGIEALRNSPTLADDEKTTGTTLLVSSAVGIIVPPIKTPTRCGSGFFNLKSLLSFKSWKLVFLLISSIFTQTLSTPEDDGQKSVCAQISVPQSPPSRPATFIILVLTLLQFTNAVKLSSC